MILLCKRNLNLLLSSRLIIPPLFVHICIVIINKETGIMKTVRRDHLVKKKNLLSNQ